MLRRIAAPLVLLLILAAPLPAGWAAPAGPAALPQAYVDTTYPSPTGRTTTVKTGGDFQAALNAAQPGDVIQLEAGSIFTGNFTLPKKTGAGWIIVRTSAPDSSLPAPGARVTPAHSSLMPKVVSPNGNPAVTAAPGSHHYRLVGIEFTITPQVKGIYSIVAFGGDQKSLEDTPHHLILDRSYVHGLPAINSFRGVLLNSASSAVIDSHISDIHVDGFDSQAILGYNGPGPFKIANNYLEGAGENIMFGGADPHIANLTPSDIEVRGNYFFKPLSWRIGHPSYAGKPWTIKNLFELKNARRVLVDGNLFENCWQHAQTGFAILFTPRNQQGGAPWSTVEDVSFVNNIVIRSASGVSFLGRDDSQQSGSTKRITIANNLFAGLEKTLFQLQGAAMDSIVIEHNTAFAPSFATLFIEAAPVTNFVYRNNLTHHGAGGISGNTLGTGTAAIQHYFPNAIFQKNVFLGGPGITNLAQKYPDGTSLVTVENAGFMDLARGDYRLGPSSPFKRAATDGKDIGMDFDALARLAEIAAGASRAARPVAR